MKFLQSIFFNKTKKVETNFSVEDYSSYIYKYVRFTQTPFIFYIKNHLDYIIINNIKYLESLNLFLNIGIEIEFYSLINNLNVDKLFKDIEKFSVENNIKIISVDKERGFNQFEIRFLPYSDIYKLFDDYDKLKYFLINSEYKISFNFSPFDYDVGSALQINLNLLDKHNNNLFSRIIKDNKKIESDHMMYSIQGILETTNIFLPLYINNDHTMPRFNKYINKILYSNGKIPAPSFNCWGVNNRTCSIRIPTPKNVKDFKDYEEEDNKNRRLEFRVPSSDSDIKKVLCGVICAISYGLKNKIFPEESTANNVFDNFNKYSEIKIIDSNFISDFIGSNI